MFVPAMVQVRERSGFMRWFEFFMNFDYDEMEFWKMSWFSVLEFLCEILCFDSENWREKKERCLWCDLFDSDLILPREHWFSPRLANDWNSVYRDKLGLLKIGLDKNAPNLGNKNLMDKMTKKDQRTKIKIER